MLKLKKVGLEKIILQLLFLKNLKFIVKIKNLVVLGKKVWNIILNIKAFVLTRKINIIFLSIFF